MPNFQLNSGYVHSLRESFLTAKKVNSFLEEGIKGEFLSID